MQCFASTIVLHKLKEVTKLSAPCFEYASPIESATNEENPSGITPSKGKGNQEPIVRVIPISPEIGNSVESWREKIDTKSCFILQAIDKHDSASSKPSPGSIQIILNSLNESKCKSSRETALSETHLEQALK